MEAHCKRIRHHRGSCCLIVWLVSDREMSLLNIVDTIQHRRRPNIIIQFQNLANSHSLSLHMIEIILRLSNGFGSLFTSKFLFSLRKIPSVATQRQPIGIQIDWEYSISRFSLLLNPPVSCESSLWMPTVKSVRVRQIAVVAVRNLIMWWLWMCGRR